MGGCLNQTIFIDGRFAVVISMSTWFISVRLQWPLSWTEPSTWWISRVTDEGELTDLLATGATTRQATGGFRTGLQSRGWSHGERGNASL